MATRAQKASQAPASLFFRPAPSPLLPREIPSPQAANMAGSEV
jgi:hypothetical protein